MGKATGLVGGRGGSQHIQWGNFYSNGIQGGIVPVATGMALAEKARQTGKIVLAFIGDGTLGEGVLYESLNMAALWKLPILIVLEDNRIAQTTPVEKGVAGSMSGRFSAYGIPVWERDTTDVLEVSSVSTEAVRHVRNGVGPGCLILHTYRFSAHSKGDDSRLPQEIARIRMYDPLTVHGARLTAEDREKAENEVMEIVEDAFIRAEADPLPILPVYGQLTDVRPSNSEN
jgi:TPP-dependent pyruvate/acetoin dehydrogenase alpha subunit